MFLTINWWWESMKFTWENKRRSIQNVIRPLKTPSHPLSPVNRLNSTTKRYWKTHLWNYNTKQEFKSTNDWAFRTETSKKQREWKKKRLRKIVYRSYMAAILFCCKVFPLPLPTNRWRLTSTIVFGFSPTIKRFIK